MSAADEACTRAAGWPGAQRLPQELLPPQHPSACFLRSDLTSQQLVGPIDWGALAQLSAVTDLLLEVNQLAGTLGAALPPALQVLWLGDNNISGTLPEAWDLPPALKVRGRGIVMPGADCLGAHCCVNTHAPLHQCPCRLDILQELKLGPNKLSGTLPAALDLPDGLQLLALNGNQLSGTLGPELRFPDSVQQLELSINQFNGTLHGLQLPSQLELLSVGFNKFMGPLPEGELKDGARRAACLHHNTSATIHTRAVLQVVPHTHTRPTAM